MSEIQSGIMATAMEGVYEDGLRIFREILLSKYKQNDNIPCKIQEGLYLGSIGAAYNKDELRRLNITHILSVANFMEDLYLSEFKHKRVEVRDRADFSIEEHFEECFAFIDEARANGGAVLVHCFAGKSRSVTIVIAYLIKTCRMTFLQAYELVKSTRPEAEPNPGFLLQLKKFERKLGVESSELE